MTQAQRVPFEAGQAHFDDPMDESPALGDEAVLEVLETEAVDREDLYRPLVGIRNGLLIGLGFWAVVLAALGLLTGLGYL